MCTYIPCGLTIDLPFLSSTHLLTLLITCLDTHVNAYFPACLIYLLSYDSWLPCLFPPFLYTHYLCLLFYFLNYLCICLSAIFNSASLPTSLLSHLSNYLSFCISTYTNVHLFLPVLTWNQHFSFPPSFSTFFFLFTLPYFLPSYMTFSSFPPYSFLPFHRLPVLSSYLNNFIRPILLIIYTPTCQYTIDPILTAIS